MRRPSRLRRPAPFRLRSPVLAAVAATLAAVAATLPGCRRSEPAAPAAAVVGLVIDVGGRGDASFNDGALRGLEMWAAGLRHTARGYQPLSPADLRLSAVGDHPRAAASLGVPVLRVRAAAVLLGGALAGLGGAALPLAILHRFDDKMPAGLGFMALAAMVFGRWRPLGALGASLFFALGSALADALRSALPPGAAALRLDGILLALPYLTALAVLASLAGRATAPAALEVPFDPEARE